MTFDGGFSVVAVSERWYCGQAISARSLTSSSHRSTRVPSSMIWFGCWPNIMFRTDYDLQCAATRSLSVEDGTWLRVGPALDIRNARLRRASMLLIGAILLATACGDREDPPPPDYVVTCDYVECETADLVRRYDGPFFSIVTCTWYDVTVPGVQIDSGAGGTFMRLGFEADGDECFEIVDDYIRFRLIRE